jgi:2-haloalkanoic acid dehalogenase type II
MTRPILFSFDIFGTVLDWRSGLAQALGRPLAGGEFDRFIDEQGRDEQAGFRSYREITARSLARFGVAPDEADRIGAQVGRWPLFTDSAEGMRRLQAIAPCVAITNSDREHGEQVQEQLGLRLADWISADQVRSYKPALPHWEEASRRSKVDFGPAWWHVSAYGDYDLSVARRLGLTCVYVPRPHCRPGPHDLVARDLIELAALAEAA